MVHCTMIIREENKIRIEGEKLGFEKKWKEEEFFSGFRLKFI